MAGAHHQEVYVVPHGEALERVRTAFQDRPRRKIEAGRGSPVSHGNHRRTEARRLFGQSAGIVAGGQGDDAKGGWVTGQHVDRLSADRPGRAEQGDPDGLPHGRING